MAALFSRRKEEKEKENQSSQKASASQSKKETKKSEEKKEVQPVQGKVGRTIASRVLVEPMITEKSHAATTRNTYVFQVRPGASKQEIKRGVEQLYDVTVEQVRVTNRKPKTRRFGRTYGVTKGLRKAYVRVKKGDSIELFKGA